MFCTYCNMYAMEVGNGCMVINHGIPNEIIEKVKEESFSFFGKPIFTKQQAGLGNHPLGYRHINIGSHRDMGEFEYLLLSAHPYYIAKKIHYHLL
ncbi:gibberellin 2-beta-dioxygenase 6 [Quercus suber]|uniref:Gibberellin 2-beta-dioxygenase 6 n=1 Tax=Quercus suber TaxID=58331 RepID=A0AAW0M0S2_QUESU